MRPVMMVTTTTQMPVLMTLTMAVYASLHHAVTDLFMMVKRLAMMLDKLPHVTSIV
jgi:hypothetical protein